MTHSYCLIETSTEIQDYARELSGHLEGERRLAAPASPKLSERNWNEGKHPSFVRQAMSENVRLHDYEDEELYLFILKGSRILECIQDAGLKSLKPFRPLVLYLESGPLWILDSQIGVMILLRADGGNVRARIHTKKEQDAAQISWTTGSILLIFGEAAVQAHDGEGSIDFILIPVQVQRIGQ